jgi:hypothetical protein
MARQSKAKRKPAKCWLSGPLEGWGATDGRRPDIVTAARLHEFLEFEGRKPEAALLDLLEALRASQLESLDMIADMLDPIKRGRWRLELKRHIRGKALSRSASFYDEVYQRYSALHFELEELGARSPRKVAERILKEEGWSPAEIRNAMQWHRKRPSEMMAFQKMVDRRKRYLKRPPPWPQPSPPPRRISAKQREKLIERIRTAATEMAAMENPRSIVSAPGKFWNAAEKKVQDTDPGPPAVRGRKR